MYLHLTKTSQILVDGKNETVYRYENAERGAIVEFFPGSIPWTFKVGIATNDFGSKIVKRVVAAFMREAAYRVKNNLSQTIYMLEINDVSSTSNH